MQKDQLFFFFFYPTRLSSFESDPLQAADGHKMVQNLLRRSMREKSNKPMTTLQRSGSFTQQSPTQNNEEHTRFESPPVSSLSKKDKTEDSNKIRRTTNLSFRRKTHSFKEKYHLPDNLHFPEIEGLLERKHELQAGGKKAALRSWKTFYTALCGKVLCFFKDKEGMEDIWIFI